MLNILCEWRGLSDRRSVRVWQIPVSMTTNGTSCSRRYRLPELQPSTFSSLRLSYAVSEKADRDALLLYIGASGEQVSLDELRTTPAD